MPMMSLAATALDQPQERGKVVDSVFKFIHTDAACCRYEPGELADRQAATFDPLLEKLRGDLGWRLRTSESIAGAQQSDETAAAVLSYLRSLDHWHLAATEELTSACKSLVLATALVREHIGIQQGITAARLEELFQIEDWGAVEAGHDLDEADISTRIAGPVLFLRLLKDGS